MLIIRTQDEPAAEEADSLFGMFLHESTRKTTPTQSWKKEINDYQEEARPVSSVDPLFWWKLNAYNYPGLCMS